MFEDNQGSIQTYTVTFVVDGKTVKTETVISGKAATAPLATPEKAYDATYHYEFDGWDKDFSKITSDLTVTAKFKGVAHIYVYAEGNGTSHGVTCQNVDCSYTATENCSGGTATCTAPATCSICNTAYGDKLGHNWGEWTTTTAATCTADGEERRDCGRCDAFETNVLTQLGHNYESVVTAPTCTDKGYTTYTCSECKDEYVDTYVDELDHAYTVFVKTIAPTCTNEGYDVYKCATCDDTTNLNTKPAAHTSDKTYVDGYVAATCKSVGATGDTKYECCNAVKVASTEIPMKSHSYTGSVKSNGNGKEATHSFKCVNGCNEYGGAVAHTWDNGVASGSSCSSGGIITYTCTVSGCAATYTETVGTVGHKGNYNGGIYIAPTCTTNGIDIKVCEVCHTEYDKTILSATGHYYSDAKVVVVDPTCTAKGYKYNVCVYCGFEDIANKTEFGNASGHYLFIQEGYDATCTETGLTEYTYCLRDNCDYKKHAQIIPAKGHRDDGKGKCIDCDSLFYGNGSKLCTCICHKDSFLAKIVYKILYFFWDLFGINKTCECGLKHK